MEIFGSNRGLTHGLIMVVKFRHGSNIMIIYWERRWSHKNWEKIIL